MNRNLAPTGRVTLVFTDVQGSTVLWERVPDAMRGALAIHDALMRDLIEEAGGYEVKTEGDAFMVSFRDPTSAAQWCIEVQKALPNVPWPQELLKESPEGLLVRMGVHMGTPDCKISPTTGRMDYFGPMVNRAARVAGAAHGGQILVSEETWSQVQEKDGLHARNLGEHHLKGLDLPERLIQILPMSLSHRTFPPPRTVKAVDFMNKEKDKSTIDVRQLDKAVAAMASALLARADARYARGHFKEALPDMETALSCAELSGDKKAMGHVLSKMGKVLWRLGDLQKAEVCFKRSLDISRSIGDLWTEALSLSDSCGIYTEWGNFEEAKGRTLRALKLNRQLGNQRGVGVASENLGLLYVKSGEWEKALPYYEEAFRCYEETHHVHGMCLIHINMGMYYLGKDIDKAVWHFQEALRNAQDVGNIHAEGLALSNLGNIHLDRGNLMEAESLTKKALELYRKVGDIRVASIASCNLALIHHLLGHFQEARGYYQEAESRLETTGDKITRAYVLSYLGALEADMGEQEKSQAYLSEAKDAFQDHSKGLKVVDVCQEVLSLTFGNHQKAENMLEMGDVGNSDVRIALRILAASLERVS